MAGSIRLYGGVKAKMPQLAERMPGYCTDTWELYIGTEEGNLLLASARGAGGGFDVLTLAPRAEPPGPGQLTADMAGGLAFKNAGGQLRHLAFRAPGVADIPEGADLDMMRQSFNSLLAALRGAGAIEE